MVKVWDGSFSGGQQRVLHDGTSWTVYESMGGLV